MKQDFILLLLLLSICTTQHSLILASKSQLPQNDPSALLDFKSHADLHNILWSSPPIAFNFCRWNGVRCTKSRAVKVVIENMNLGGVFASNTLTRLDQLRVLSLNNDSLTGRIPDLSGLPNLKALFLSRNYFSDSVPPSISFLHRLKTVDLSYNMLAGSIPESMTRLVRLYCLRLEFNRFNGFVPPFNQSSLQIFNVSHNLLSGAIPATSTLLRFETTSSFSLNSDLCGEIIHKECHSVQPFFEPEIPAARAPTLAGDLGQTTQVQNGVALNKKEGLVQRMKHKKAVMIIGLSSGVSFFALSLICLAFVVGKCRRRSSGGEMTKMGLIDPSVTGNAEAVMRIAEENEELEEKVKRVQEEQNVGQSGALVFFAGEPQAYTLDQLMRASAELLGRGTMGTTYKAVLDDGRSIVTVKRLDGAILRGVSRGTFARHMESVGALRHPNLVPLRAYLQAREERLLVYDYCRNGSLCSLIHGSKSARTKPLHWTSCLKMAEDVAQGLSYIHQAWRLVHGNLKSSNVLLGSDFEACLTDYCLLPLTNSPHANQEEEEDANSIHNGATEIRKSHSHHSTSECDVYSFGVLLLELLTGKYPSEHPNLASDAMLSWMRSIREHDRGENRSEMLLKVVTACVATVPERRPTVSQVLKMIQEIKETVLKEDIGF